MKFKSLFLVLLVATILLFGSNIVATYFLRPKMISYIRENCDKCEIEIESIRIGPLFNSFTFNTIHFKTGDPQQTAIDTHIESMQIEISLSDLFNKVIHVEQVVLFKPNVKVIEGDLKSKASTDNSSPTEGQQYYVDVIYIEKAHFTYSRVHAGKSAPINVGQIHAQIGQLGNAQELRDHKTEGNLTAVLEQSGKVTLKVDAFLFKGPVTTDIDLRVQNQSLSQLNPYFQTNDGVKMAGNLLDGHSGISIKGEHLQGFVQAEYKDFKIDFEKTSERSAFTAFLSNLVSKIKLNTKNVQAKRAEQIQYIAATRNKGETLLSFIFRGMKEASLSVASKPLKKK